MTNRLGGLGALLMQFSRQMKGQNLAKTASSWSLGAAATIDICSGGAQIRATCSITRSSQTSF